MIACRTPRTAEISRSAAGTACFWMQEIELLVVSITPDRQTMQSRRCVMRRFCSLHPSSALKPRRCQDFHVSGTHGRSRRLHPDTAFGRPSAHAAGGKPSSVSVSAVMGIPMYFCASLACFTFYRRRYACGRDSVTQDCITNARNRVQQHIYLHMTRSHVPRAVFQPLLAAGAVQTLAKLIRMRIACNMEICMV